MSKTVGELCGFEKRAVQTGLLGYLTSPLVSQERAAEVKGKHKARGERADSVFIDHPFLSRAIAPLVGGVGGASIGGLLGSLGGGAAGVASDSPLKGIPGMTVGGLTGAGLGGYAGTALGALLSPLLQQRAVNKAIKASDPDDKEALKRWRT